MSFVRKFRLALQARGWSREASLAVVLLFFGCAVMPMLIFFTGAYVLGRYEGASLPGLYGSVYRELEKGSASAWIVLLGPYGLYLIFKLLAAWWRTSAPRRRSAE